MLVFDCKKCGQCCAGRGGIILAPKDLIRLASYLNITPEQVIAEYAVQSNGRIKLKQAENGFCLFFQAGRGCAIHPAKPDVCKAWPFFRGNLEDVVSYEMAREYCPGIDKSCGHDEFVRQGMKWLADERLIFKAGPQTPNALVNAHLQKYSRGDS